MDYLRPITILEGNRHYKKYQKTYANSVVIIIVVYLLGILNLVAFWQFSLGDETGQGSLFSGLLRYTDTQG